MMTSNSSEFYVDLYKKQGWIIADAEKPENLVSVKNNFINEMRTLLKTKIEGIGDIRKHLSNLSESEINEIRSLSITNYSLCLVEAFGSIIKVLCGESIFVQKRLEVNISPPNKNVTMSHTEFQGGHSPFTLTIWVPLHDIDDYTGIFCLGHKESLSFIEENNVDRMPYEEEFLYEKSPPPIRLKFGQGIVFNSFVLHGSVPNNTLLARLALSVRANSCQRPLFHKNLGYFDKFSLT